MSRCTELIDVAVAVVIRDQRVLLTYRSSQQDCGDLWEFPGGKFEPGETAYQALCRECLEEIGIDILAASPLLSVLHAYSRYTVRLHVWRVERFDKQPVAREGQPMRWVALDQLHQYAIPAANEPIVAAISDSRLVRLQTPG